jgi:hypothetical protein
MVLVIRHLIPTAILSNLLVKILVAIVLTVLGISSVNQVSAKLCMHSAKNVKNPINAILIPFVSFLLTIKDNVYPTLVLKTKSSFSHGHLKINWLVNLVILHYPGEVHQAIYVVVQGLAREQANHALKTKIVPLQSMASMPSVNATFRGNIPAAYCLKTRYTKSFWLVLRTTTTALHIVNTTDKVLCRVLWT